ncbi:glycosyltransferase family 2 protein [Branchiibius cervicis]|uniref:Glycosyltransferase family 2 protein n=1 Tax=Branchiibius cervicis TaxID=908252 RepID=A0ABW2APN1_9MICO
MIDGRTLSVVLPTYNEKDSIGACIRGFLEMPEVDEVIAVNNNAAPGTSEEIAAAGGREVFESTQGYGAAIQRGLLESTGDLIVVCEPDGTFDPKDLRKLVAFLPECDVVIGSRTVSGFIWERANMGWFLRWGNWAVAKMIEVGYNTPSLSDVGCTFRVMTREQVEKILARSTTTGSAYGLEMMLLALVDGAHVVQVPVNYHERVGVSAVTGDLGKTLSLGFGMMGMAARMRLQSKRIRDGRIPADEISEVVRRHRDTVAAD